MPAAVAASATGGKDFKEARLQIRLSTGGQPLTTTLPSEAREFTYNPSHSSLLLRREQHFAKLRSSSQVNLSYLTLKQLLLHSTSQGILRERR